MDITVTHAKPISLPAVRIGQVITGLVGAFLLFDAVVHALSAAPAVESFRALGFDAGVALPLGLLETACLALYLIPRTAPLGAVLLTGYLGGAVCAHVRAESPLWSTTLFPVYVGIAAWVGLYLRNAKIRDCCVNDRRCGGGR